MICDTRRIFPTNSAVSIASFFQLVFPYYNDPMNTRIIKSSDQNFSMLPILFELRSLSGNMKNLEFYFAVEMRS